jgi:hypothetical protein
MLGKNRLSLKTIAFLFPEGSIERAYLHGRWQRSRGRNPSLTFGNEKQAHRFYAAAHADLGDYFDQIFQLPFSRRKFFWHQEMITAVESRAPIEQLPRRASLHQTF